MKHLLNLKMVILVRNESRAGYAAFNDNFAEPSIDTHQTSGVHKTVIPLITLICMRFVVFLLWLKKVTPHIHKIELKIFVAE